MCLKCIRTDFKFFKTEFEFCVFRIEYKTRCAKQLKQQIQFKSTRGDKQTNAQFWHTQNANTQGVLIIWCVVFVISQVNLDRCQNPSRYHPSENAGPNLGQAAGFFVNDLIKRYLI